MNQHPPPTSHPAAHPDAAPGPRRLNVEEAFRKLAERVRIVRETEEVALADGIGRVAATAIVAPVDLPPFHASAMDGYAVAAAGHDHDRRKRFDVVDESLAGHPAQRRVGPGEAIRIFTGAVLPDGADAVVLQEDVASESEVACTAAPIRSGQHVRRRGHDVLRGAILCRQGTRLSAFELSWLAACGISRLRVVRPIRAAVFSTGDELADAGAPLGPGQIYDSNRFAILSLLREKAVEITDLGCLPDDPAAIRQALQSASRSADLVVTSGGVSVGGAYFVKEVVEEIGTIDFWRIALKPGKPLAVGAVGDALFIGLPGNPVSTIVTYLLFVAPAVDLLCGMPPSAPMELPAMVTHPVRHSRGRREYMRGTLCAEQGELVVDVTGDQGSNRLATFAGANCLMVVDADIGDLRAGDPVRVVLLPRSAGHLFESASA